MKDDLDFDFGFSTVSEDELSSATKETVDKKLEGMLKLITPLLNNLMANPEKEYIHWPDRVEKIKAFKAKLEKYVKE